MRTIAPAMRALLDAGGPFLGDNKASSRLTVEPGWHLNVSGSTFGSAGSRRAKKLPIRWWQKEANDQVEVEIPHVQSVQIVRDLTQQAATLVANIYNNQLGTLGGDAVGLASKLGQPGYYSWNYGASDKAVARWNQVPNAWEDMLNENACIRVYQGYGGQSLTIPEAVAAGNLLLTGVFLLDDPAITASTGIITLNGRDMAKLLIDQYTVPPLIPVKRYPLNYWGPDQALNQATVAISPADAAILATYGANGWAASRTVPETSSQGSGSDAIANMFKCLDMNPKTAWQSEIVVAAGYVSADNPFPYVQFSCEDQTTGFYIDPLYGDYRVYVSVMVGGDWVDHGLPGTINDIPYIMVVHVPWEVGKWYHFTQRYNCTSIRLTFASLFQLGSNDQVQPIPGGSGDGTYAGSGQWVAAMRTFLIGQRQDLTASSKIVTGFATSPDNFGYHLMTAGGLVFRYGSAINRGDLTNLPSKTGKLPGEGTAKPIKSPATGFAAPSKGGAYWICQQNGLVTPFGTDDNVVNGAMQRLPSFGQLSGNSGAHIVSLRCRTDEKGYWMITAQGKIHAFGNAVHYGDMVTLGINSPSLPVVDMCSNADDNGYWILRQDGTIKNFGSTTDYGNATTATGQLVGMDRTAGTGFWVVDTNGQVQIFGDAINYGNVPGDQPLPEPIYGMRRSSSYLQEGYYLWAEDGSVYNYGDALPYGDLQGLQALPPDYTDYADIIFDLALWAGFWLNPTTTLPSYSRPTVFGVIEKSGAWDTLGPLGIDFYDKRPVIDVMTDIANLIGFIVRVDEIGRIRFEVPNIWADGNFDDTITAMVNEDLTPYIPVIDERLSLSEYVMTQSDVNLRSPITVAVSDPYAYGGPVKGTNVTKFIPPYTPALKGIIKSAEYTVPLQVDALDQQFLAELIAIRIWQSCRTGSTTAWCDPSICVNDQVRIFEASTGETNIHYVTALQTTHTLEDGKFEMQLTTNWMGDTDNWAITSNLATDWPGGTTGTPGVPHTYLNGKLVGGALGQYSLSNQLAQNLGLTGSGKTAVYTSSTLVPPLYSGITNPPTVKPIVGDRPTISGVRNASAPVPGITLTCDPGSFSGTPPITVSFAWNNTAGGSSSATYLVQSGDVGNLISCTVTGTNGTGSDSATAAASGNVVGANGPVNTTLPFITGTPTAGNTVTCSNGVWTGSGLSYSFTWNAAGQSLTNTYVLEEADAGLTVSCVVTARDSTGASLSVASLDSDEIAGAGTAPFNVLDPVITGILASGQVMTCSSGTWTGSGPMTFAYFWQNTASSSSVATYTVAGGDVGNVLSCLVTATNSVDSADAISDPTGIVGQVPANTSLPVISGAAVFGGTLFCSPGIWDGQNPMTFEYLWVGTDIPTTVNFYAPDANDVGNTVTCTVTAVNAAGFGTVTSAASDTIV